MPFTIYISDSITKQFDKIIAERTIKKGEKLSRNKAITRLVEKAITDSSLLDNDSEDDIIERNREIKRVVEKTITIPNQLDIDIDNDDKLFEGV